MDKLSLDKRNLRKFGITMGTAIVIMAVILFFRHKDKAFSLLSVSALFFISGFIAPFLLKPLYIIWMRFAFILSWFNTRMILFIIFYLIFTPIGLVMRFLGVDPLNRKIDKNKDSYWQKIDRKPFSRLSYEKRF